MYGVFTGPNVALRYDCEHSGMATVCLRMVYYWDTGRTILCTLGERYRCGGVRGIRSGDVTIVRSSMYGMVCYVRNVCGCVYVP